MFHVERSWHGESRQSGCSTWNVPCTADPPSPHAPREALLSPLRRLLESGLRELEAGRDPEEDALSRLVALAELVASWAARMNLTAHRTPEAIADRLILESLALAAALPRVSSLVDLGSGAGFPGLPIAVRYPEREIVMIEARERRHHFQRAAARQLGLQNVRPLLGRAEQLDPIPHPLVIAQAVAPPARVLDWMIGWAAPDGLLAIPGSETALELPPRPEVSEVRVIEYTVPGSRRRRTVWVGRRKTLATR